MLPYLELSYIFAPYMPTINLTKPYSKLDIMGIATDTIIVDNTFPLGWVFPYAPVPKEDIEKLVLQILEQRELEVLARQIKTPTFLKPKKAPSVENVKNNSEEHLEVAYRLASKQLLQLGRQFLSQQFNQQNKTVAFQFLSSEWGTAVVASFILTMLADKFPQKHLEILSKELRVSTLALVGNDTVELLKETLTKVNLPQETCKSVPSVLEQTYEQEKVYETRGISKQ